MRFVSPDEKENRYSPERAARFGLQSPRDISVLVHGREIHPMVRLANEVVTSLQPFVKPNLAIDAPPNFM